MTRKLTARIKDVEAAGRMWMVDWDTEPIPSPSPDSPSSLSGSAPSPKAASGGLPSRMKRSRWAEEEAQQGLAAQQQLQPRKLTKQQRQQLWQQQQQEGGKRQKKGAAAAAAAGAMATQEQVRRDARAGRFADGRAVGGLQSWHRRQQQDDGDSESDSSSGEEELDLSTLTVKGTCTDLEKSYFRLTAAPDPSVVRPEPVLRRALDRLVSLLRQDDVNYFYACDQLKGMRQDCTVQHLRGGVAVAVYEAHARASLEYGDLAEFNQCQTQLASLYPDPLQYLQQLQQQSKGGTSSSSGGSGGAAAAPAPAAGQVAAGCVAEFVAYKVLYNAAHAHVGANKTVLLHTLRTAMALAGTPVDASGCIAHALASRAAAASCNFSAFFRLYVTAPALGRALLDVIAPKLRWAALNMLVKAYKTNLPVSFVAGVMGFCPQEDGSKSSAEQQREEPLPGCRHTVYVGRAAPAANVEEGVAACVQWLKAHGAVVEEPEGAEPQLDVKASCTGRLFIPEEPKVSHGDENLSLQDFLSRAALGLGSNS
ncbi:SAC3/GANP/Nin1/mts3/eIF-3 p25 family-domain-containing protein [Dunaliella salina]|uniref:SAC3/GANP/Nin1/mts3/eIF-3 p25 family-domain-containing protein n=1 Tax=Dunaliella salina TaxID=3046 RepID=A0ABQ7G9G0_DUNSA|nr:SAC3/GANP/Nin1/mts3/eIF-3 p25 family-domain-containing protein [Dunaliella salina]|eukprot:KAF5831238.1 SAC3/GANP/Nin1/mts3/eIF-3 p25 family-domain-containing protein [Dunaliella salina]